MDDADSKGSEAPESPEPDFYATDSPSQETAQQVVEDALQAGRQAHNGSSTPQERLLDAQWNPNPDRHASEAQQLNDTLAELERPFVDDMPVTNGQPARNDPPVTTGMPAVQSAPASNGEAADHDDHDDSSEMDMSESSRSSSLEPDQEQAVDQDNTSHMGTKRKLSDTHDTLDALEQALTEDLTKKRKISTPPQDNVQAVAVDTAVADQAKSPAERWPAEIWQQVFLRLSPAMLSRCLRVSRSFNTILTQAKAQLVNSSAKKSKDPEKDKVKLMDSDAIWAEARKNYFPNMPRPLMRCNELSMLQLIGCKNCQFCGRVPAPVPATSPFNAGPGPTGVRMVWPFGLRTCGQCWEQNTIKVG